MILWLPTGSWLTPRMPTISCGCGRARLRIGRKLWLVTVSRTKSALRLPMIIPWSSPPMAPLLICPAAFEVISKDPVLSANYRPNFGDFRTDYLLFDTFNPPFNDKNVRLAFAKAVDRASIVKNVMGAQFAIPAYSFLAPGFPASDTNGDLKSIQAYDCDAAKKLLADAGFTDGKGFPAQELELRGENETHQAWFVAVAG